MSEGKKSVYKPKPVSGFPEWLPEVRLVEQQWLDHIRRVFESYGFCSVETPSIEELEVLHAKGEVDKEIYVLERLHKEEGDKEARLALHFDQTVPLARYVAQHWDKLVFPFKRYQMQRVWRGERPQAGRFREFTQCDIDVINNDTLPLHFDAEMPAIIWEVLNGLPGMEGQKFQIRINNRKILTGFLNSLEIQEPETITKVINLLDKSEKIGWGRVQDELIKTFLDLHKSDQIFKALNQYRLAAQEISKIQINNSSFSFDTLKQYMNVDHPLIKEGLKELKFVMDSLSNLSVGSGIVADLLIVRGLDYYTGTVYETVFTENPAYGSICSGGRYDDLAGQYINKKLPGVGISIGFSRLFDYMRSQNKLIIGPKSPADVLMLVRDEKRPPMEQEELFQTETEKRRAKSAATAQILRRRGLKVELYHTARKLADQIKYADRKGIPYVWIPPIENESHQVKNMTTGEQKPADPQSWQPEKENINAAA